MICGCGSGLRAQSCCAARPEALRPIAAGRHLDGLAARAAELLRAGDGAAAEALAIEVLELAPWHVAALVVLYERRKEPAGEVLLRRILGIDPNHVWAIHELALRLFAAGRMAEAEAQARNAVRIGPDQAAAHKLLAMVLTEGRKPAAGEHHYRAALRIGGAGDPVLLANLAWNLKTQGRMEEARALYRQADAAGPPPMQTLLGWAKLEEADRDLEAAAALLDRAEAAEPGHPAVRLTRAALLGRLGRAEAGVAEIDAIAAGRTGGGLTADECLERGRLLDRIGQYDAAWACFVEGKRLAREAAGHGYLAGPAAAAAARSKAFFTADRLRALPRATPAAGSQPLFILGFPRSGTTMVEQMLSRHSRIAAGDELPLVAELVDRAQRRFDSPLPYPEALAELWMGDLRDGLDLLRDDYLRGARLLGVRPDAGWFTDKMPQNELHLGLIGMVFPASPLLHVVRHPLDVVVSVFSNQMTHGYSCALDLEGIARQIALTHDVVAHVRGAMDLRYRAVRYEEIVAGQEAALRGMLAFVGEDFDPACLRFEENRRYARTASYAQVAEGLYDRSVGRWRHYARYLEPVMGILDGVL